MEPLSETRATLSDLLDRLLEKGLVVRADIIITLAGIPLIGVTLSAAIAGMETMIKYGLLTDWDNDIRRREALNALLRESHPSGRVLNETKKNDANHLEVLEAAGVKCR